MGCLPVVKWFFLHFAYDVEGVEATAMVVGGMAMA